MYEDEGRGINVSFHVQKLGQVFAKMGGEMVGKTGEYKSCKSDGGMLCRVMWKD